MCAATTVYLSVARGSGVLRACRRGCPSEFAAAHLLCSMHQPAGRLLRARVPSALTDPPLAGPRRRIPAGPCAQRRQTRAVQRQGGAAGLPRSCAAAARIGRP
eukprot:gnl/Chilomastix_cuspidata/5969.p5 GENE.gnl/Chilomastix_cuspidata/5969~~gnl/Chilomastix_cuspidata/5969.p5  ORF type:complete len:103 (+),score=8.38 gnl/Chilomastix_cuspidata/5969:650-958(+)